MPKKKTIATILKLKDSKKKELELKVKEVHDRVDKEEEKLIAFEREYKDTHDVFTNQSKEGSIGPDKISSYYNYFSNMTAKIDKQKDVHLQWQKKLALVKESFINAHKEKKVFEIMKEKALKKEIKERIESEQKEADFFMLSRKLR